jgi:ComF family protein
MNLGRLPERLLDAAYPGRCGICGLLGDKPICSVCGADFAPCDDSVQTPEWRGSLEGAARLFRYQGRAEQAVVRLKFARATSLARPMSRHMASYAVRLGLDETDVVVPVPIHWRRRFHRGFNQSQLLCEALPNVRLGLLRRIKATKPQVGLDPEERRRNLIGAFRCAERLDGKTVLLLDDVITTGHTVGECARALKEAGAMAVYAISFTGG